MEQKRLQQIPIFLKTKTSKITGQLIGESIERAECLFLLGTVSYDLDSAR